MKILTSPLIVVCCFIYSRGLILSRESSCNEFNSPRSKKDNKDPPVNSFSFQESFTTYTWACWLSFVPMPSIFWQVSMVWRPHNLLSLASQSWCLILWSCLVIAGKAICFQFISCYLMWQLRLPSYTTTGKLYFLVNIL